MAEYSGEILINTKINNEQAEKGADNLNKIFENLKTTIESVGEKLNQSLGQIGEQTQYIGDFMTGFAEGLVDGLNQGATASQETGQAIKETAKETEVAEKKVHKLRDAFKGFASGAWSSVKAVASHMTDLVKKTRSTANNTGNMVKNFLKAAIGLQWLNAILNKIKKAFDYGSKNLAGWSESYNNAVSDVMNGLNQLKNNIAAAFQPIVETVAPIISNFIDLLNQGVNKVAQFFAALTGKNTYTKAIKQAEKYIDTQKKATKEMKNGLNALEELNVIGHDSNTDAAVANDVKNGLFETARVDDSISKLVKQVKDAFANGDFTAIGRQLGTSVKNALESIPWDDVKDFANKTASSVATFLNGIVDSGVIAAIGTAAAEGLNTITGSILTFATTFNWENAGTELANGLSNFFETTDWKQAGQAVSKTATGVLKFMNAAVAGVHWDEVGKAIVDFMAEIDWLEIFGEATTLAGNVGQGIYQLITGERVEGDFKKSMEEVAASIEDGTWIDAAKLWATDIFDGIKAVLNDAAGWIKEHVIDPILEALGLAEDLDVMVRGDEEHGILNAWDWFWRGMPEDNVGMHFDRENKSAHGHGSTIGFAKGTVVPRTAKPFYGILGDNNQETEVVSPLSTMKEAMIEAMAEANFTGSGDQNISLSIDGQKLFDWLIQKNKDTFMRTHQNQLMW